MRKRQVFGLSCGVFWFGFGIFILFGLSSIINEVILEGVVLDPATFDVWGENPGQTGTVTLRNFTFYNFTNPREYLYHNATPKFTEISNYLFQERSNFTNPIFT